MTMPDDPEPLPPEEHCPDDYASCEERGKHCPCWYWTGENGRYPGTRCCDCSADNPRLAGEDVVCPRCASQTCRHHASELAALRAQRDAARESLRGLVATLPRCDGRLVVSPTRGLQTYEPCRRPATHAYRRGEERYCWVHAPPGCPAYPRASALRAALALLEET